MNSQSLSRLCLGLCSAGLVTVSTSAAVVFDEGFTGNTNSLVLDIDPTATATVAGEQLQIASNGFSPSSAHSVQTVSDSFVLSADVVNTGTVGPPSGQSSMLFTNGSTGVYAFGTSRFADNGYTALVRNAGFVADEFAFQLVGPGETILAASSVFDLVQDFEDDYASYNITMTGTFVGSDLQISATFTPDAADNPTALSPITLTATVVSPDLTGNQFGVRQVSGGNYFSSSYDNISLDVVPEPSSMVALGAMGVLMAKRRRRIG